MTPCFVSHLLFFVCLLLLLFIVALLLLFLSLLKLFCSAQKSAKGLLCACKLASSSSVPNTALSQRDPSGEVVYMTSHQLVHTHMVMGSFPRISDVQMDCQCTLIILALSYRAEMCFTCPALWTVAPILDLHRE